MIFFRANKKKQKLWRKYGVEDMNDGHIIATWSKDVTRWVEQVIESRF